MWESKLDKLLDLTVFQCSIMLCDNPSKGCVKGTSECMGHISCGCPKELKLPVLELKWLFYQRQKEGERSMLGMVLTDWSETHRQVKSEKRRIQGEVAAENYTKRRMKETEKIMEQFQEEEVFVESADMAAPVDTDDSSDDDRIEEEDLAQPPEPGELLFAEVFQQEVTDELEKGSIVRVKRKEVGTEKRAYLK